MKVFKNIFILVLLLGSGSVFGQNDDPGNGIPSGAIKSTVEQLPDLLHTLQAENPGKEIRLIVYANKADVDATVKMLKSIVKRPAPDSGDEFSTGDELEVSDQAIEMQPLFAQQAGQPGVGALGTPSMLPAGFGGATMAAIASSASLQTIAITIVVGGGTVLTGVAIFTLFISHTTGGGGGGGDSPPQSATTWIQDNANNNNIRSASEPVGIGTTTPDSNYKLEVAGAAYFNQINLPEIKSGGTFVMQNNEHASMLNITDSQVGINTASLISGVQLTVKGKSLFYDGTVPTRTFSYTIAASTGVLTKEVAFIPATAWPDFVFERSYKLMKLSDLETYISSNKHLPSFPSEKQVVSEGEFRLNEHLISLLKQVEELTLYKIETNKKLREAQQDLSALKN